MTTKNYNDQPMIGITEADYETLLVHLTDQVATRLQWAEYDEAHKAACDALTNAWQPEMTAREWLDATGTRLSVDTSGCVGV